MEQSAKEQSVESLSTQSPSVQSSPRQSARQTLFADSAATTLPQLEAAERHYRSIPFEAILKQDLLRLGVGFDSGSLEGENFKSKDYFIFSFDHLPLKSQQAQLRFRIPEEIRISGGPFQLLPTVVSVRVNPHSPYQVKLLEGKRVLVSGQQFLGLVEFPPIPAYYNHSTQQGKAPGEVAPVIQWGYLIYLTVFRNCQYFGKEEECAFCDINHNYRQQKNEGRPYTGVKSVQEILEVLSWIDKEDKSAGAYTITGGSVTQQLRGKNEMDFYYEYASNIEQRFPQRWIGKIVTQAWPKEHLRPFGDVGIKIYHPNYEVWDRRLFQLLCPGKERFIGRDNWIQRILEATEVFGPQGVIPNFVAGVELSKPYGFSSVAEAIQSTAEGLDFFMRRGVMPRFTTWCPEPYTTLLSLAEQPPVPLEYFLQLLTVWKETFERYNLPVPQGYGAPGAGRAVFSVSPFMDLIGYPGRN